MAFAKKLKSEKGVFVTLIAAAFVVLGLFVGLAVDAGRVYLTWARTSKTVDAAALVAAKAAASGATLAEATSLATAAACDSARLNGHSINGGPGTCPPGLTVSIQSERNPDGFTQLGVTVKDTNTMNTSFVALGTLIGCGDICRSVNVSASASAVPDTLVDLVLVMDDTGTMNSGCNSSQTNSNCPIKGARDGAIALVNMLIPDTGSSNAKISVVPFRGCYAILRLNPPSAPNQNAGAGCTLFSEILGLTNDKTTLTTRINGLRAPGGYPGTNICNGMFEGLGRNLNRGGLFGPGTRALAKKVMVVLTDGDNTYSDNAGQGGNLGNPTPWPYPTTVYVPVVGQLGSDPGTCRSTIAPNVNYDGAIDMVDTLANTKATSIKKPSDPNDQVEIFVLRFSNPSTDSAQTTPCAPAMIGSGNARTNGSDAWDRNLSRCIASNTALGDPFSKSVNDHYFFAATPAQITTQFLSIAKELLKRLRLLT